MQGSVRRKPGPGWSHDQATVGSAPEHSVVVEGLTKHYGAVHALDGISFAAAPGEVFGLLGHNGAWKSTTIRILTGRSRPTDGTATILGHDVVGDFEHIRGDITSSRRAPRSTCA